MGEEGFPSPAGSDWPLPGLGSDLPLTPPPHAVTLILSLLLGELGQVPSPLGFGSSSPN